jgi:hypothetical protein
MRVVVWWDLGLVLALGACADAPEPEAWMPTTGEQLDTSGTPDPDTTGADTTGRPESARGRDRQARTGADTRRKLGIHSSKSSPSVSDRPSEGFTPTIRHAG